MLKSSILAALLATALPFAAYAQDKGADTVVATVNGTPITLGEMIVMKEAASQDPQLADMPDSALYEMMLDQLIQRDALPCPTRAVFIGSPLAFRKVLG